MGSFRDNKRINSLLRYYPLLLVWGCFLLAIFLAIFHPSAFFVMATAVVILNTHFFVLTFWYGVVGLRKFLKEEKVDHQKEYDLIKKRMEEDPEDVKSVKWEDVIHYIIIPNYKEHLTTLQESIARLASSKVAKMNMIVVLAMEGAEQGCEEKALKLISKNQHSFLDILFTKHPVGLPGEARGKASNEAWAFQRIIDHVKSQGYNSAHVTVTSADADSIFHQKYFEALSMKFCTDPQRYSKIWQAPMLFLKNFSTIPALTRVYSEAVSMHELSCLADERDEHLPASTYSLSLKLAEEVNGWDTDFIAEDWHMFLKCFFESSGRAVVEPIFLPVLAYSVESDTWWQSIKDRLVQAYRHAMGLQEARYSMMQLYHTILGNNKKEIPPAGRLFTVWYKINGMFFIPSAYLYCTVLGYLLIGYYTTMYPDASLTELIAGRWSLLFRYLNLFQSISLMIIWTPVSFLIIKFMCKDEQIHWYSLFYMMIENMVWGFLVSFLLAFYPFMKASLTIALTDEFEYIVATKPEIGKFEEESTLSQIESQNTAKAKMLGVAV